MARYGGLRFTDVYGPGHVVTERQGHCFYEAINRLIGRENAPSKE